MQLGVDLCYTLHKIFFRNTDDTPAENADQLLANMKDTDAAMTKFLTNLHGKEVASLYRHEFRGN